MPRGREIARLPYEFPTLFLDYIEPDDFFQFPFRDFLFVPGRTQRSVVDEPVTVHALLYLPLRMEFPQFSTVFEGNCPQKGCFILCKSYTNAPPISGTLAG